MLLKKIKALTYNPKHQKIIFNDIKNDKYNKHKDTKKQINQNDVKKFLWKKKEEIVKQQFIKKPINRRILTNIINSLDREIQEKMHALNTMAKNEALKIEYEEGLEL